MKDTSLIARKLCQTRLLVCASPSYLAEHPAINEPQDLKNHRILQYGSSKRPKWTFTFTKNKELSVSLISTLNSHDGGFLIDAAERGLGVAKLPDFMALTPIQEGRLHAILPQYATKPIGVYVVYPAARYLPNRTRQLVDFLIQSTARPEQRNT